MDLVVIKGANRGEVVGLTPGSNILGRDADVEIPTLDDKASRRHAEIVPGDDGYVLRDLDSHNGTFLNGIPIIEAPLQTGDEILIGRTIFLVATGAQSKRYCMTGRSTLSMVGPGGDEEPAAVQRPAYIIGRSAIMKDVFRLIGKAAATDATVLISGESGTGKELAAGAIHHSSRRRRGPFSTVNCASLRGDLLESELFGHERGAFTGAVARRAGLLELANGGTLFLDEIGELPPDGQARLLRVAEGKPFTRIGGSGNILPDVRILAATNRDLSNEVKAGRFREDLYHRLKVLEIHLPALRDRTGDLVLLVEHFLQEFSETMRGGCAAISEEAIAVLDNHPWRGNVRELRNVLERALIYGDSGQIEVSHLPLDIRMGMGEAPDSPGGMMPLQEVERRHILRCLETCGGNKAKAAETLGIDRTTLYRKLEKYSIDA